MGMVDVRLVGGLKKLSNKTWSTSIERVFLSTTHCRELVIRNDDDIVFCNIGTV